MPDPITTTLAATTTADAPRPLPDGWRWARLGDVCELNPRRPEITRPDGAPTSFIPMAAVTEGGADMIAVEQRPYSEVRKGYTYLAEGDVLFAKITPCMQNGKHAVARGLIDGIGFGSTEFHILRPLTDVTAEWLQAFLRQPVLLANAEAHMTGAVGQQRLPTDYLADLLIPLPPLAEQRHIAAILAARMAAVERARAAAQAEMEAAQALPAAELRAIFESDEAQAWPRVRVGDVAKVQSGYAFKSEWFNDEGIRLLRNTNVHQGFVDWDDTVHLPFARRAEYAAYELNAGDIVLSLDRPVVAGGLKLTRLSEADIPALLLQRVGRFILSDRIDSGYLYSFLSSQEFVYAITQHDQSLGVPHVSPGQVEDVTLPLPPISNQRYISAALDARMAEITRLRASLAAQLDTINALPAALLRQAFNGEL